MRHFHESSDIYIIAIKTSAKAAKLSSGSGLTAAEAAIIAAACTAVAVLAVGILNVFSQRKQLRNQENQSDRQLKEQRELLERQLEAQRAQSDHQMSEQRKLQMAEFDVEARKIVREEKKAVYASMLAGCREIQAMWQLMADQHPESLMINLNSMMSRVEENREAIRTGLAEIELIGSLDVVGLVTAYTERTGILLSKFISTSESAIERVGRPTAETLSEAQAAIRNEISTGEISRIFFALREKMRSEILGTA